MKAKEYLFNKGLIPAIGKGRISHANHEALQEAYDSGQRFSDWPKGVLMVNEAKDKDTGETVEKVTYNRTDGYGDNGNPVDIAPYLYNLTTHAVYEDTQDGSKGFKRSLKEVCANDGVSLVQCTCGAPRVVARNGVGHVDVTIYAETSAPAKGDVWARQK